MSPHGFERVQGLRRVIYDSHDYREGICAFKEKRSPVFALVAPGGAAVGQRYGVFRGKPDRRVVVRDGADDRGSGRRLERLRDRLASIALGMATYVENSLGIISEAIGRSHAPLRILAQHS